MEFDFVEIAESNKKANDEFASYALALVKTRSRLLAKNFDKLTPTQILEQLQELRNLALSQEIDIRSFQVQDLS